MSEVPPGILSVPPVVAPRFMRFTLQITGFVHCSWRAWEVLRILSQKLCFMRFALQITGFVHSMSQKLCFMRFALQITPLMFLMKIASAEAIESLNSSNISKSNESMILYANTPVNALDPHEPISIIFIVSGVACVVSACILIVLYKQAQHKKDVTEWINYSSVFDGIKMYV
jgi:hypothetical protein